MQNKNWKPTIIALITICLLGGAGISLLGYHYFSKPKPAIPPSDWQSKIKPTKEMVEKIVFYENGKQSVVDLKSQDGKGITSLLTRKLQELNLQAKCFFSEERIQEIKQKDKVVELVLKTPIDLNTSQWVEPEERYHNKILENTKNALFILEDNQERGLAAHILVGHKLGHEPEGKTGYGCWTINLSKTSKPEIDKTWIDALNRLKY